MGYNSGDKEGTIVPATTMATSGSTVSANLGTYSEIALHLIWSGADKSDATVDIQGSLNGTNFESFDGAIYTMAAAAGNHVWRVILGAVPYIKIVFNHGTATAGSYSVLYREEV